jgi:hypothetical protein
MSDLQTITTMLTRAKIGISIDATRVTDASGNGQPLPVGLTITVDRVEDGRQRTFGYAGFYAEFYFDDDGALVGVGAWE